MRRARMVVAALFAVMPAPLMALTCVEVVQRIRALDAQRIAAGDCEPPPSRHLGVPWAPAAGTCKPDPHKVHAWWVAHKAAYDALVAQLGACNRSVCPAIKAIAPCRCATKNLPPSQCPCLLTQDSDGDGIPDAEEARLIARYSPYLRFTDEIGSGSERYRPADPAWYAARSELVAEPDGRVLVPAASLQANPENVLSAVPGGGSALLARFNPDPAFKACTAVPPRAPLALHAVAPGTLMGAEWAQVRASANVGLFAHVSPFTPNSAQDLAAQCARTKGDGQPVIPRSGYEAQCAHCYKIEYYQFFAFNEPGANFEIAIHEGDWSILTLVYDADRPQAERVLAVSHWAHGYEMRFDMLAGPRCSEAETPGFCTRTDVPGFCKQKVCTGANSAYDDFEIVGGADFTTQQEPEKAQNNTVAFAPDPQTGELVHPVAYVEFGAHEFWPSARWSARKAPAHTGNDGLHSYLGRDIPNLGEVEHPMGREGALIAGYAGSWGFNNILNSPPPGPALHKSWNWWTKLRAPIGCRDAE